MLLLASETQAQHSKRRLENGLRKQTLFNGLYTLGVPNIFGMDVMHLSTLNDPDLLLGLWRGTAKYISPDSTAKWDWPVRRDAVEYIPEPFGREPRKPAEKINSSYKAWECLIWIYGLGPIAALLRHTLPRPYWLHYCKVVSAIRILGRRVILQDELKKGNKHLKDFATGFGELYYQRKQSRLPFLRQSIHLITLITAETIRVGPMACCAQRTKETAIGNLGREIRTRALTETSKNA
jgi:hypothetical protein